MELMFAIATYESCLASNVAGWRELFALADREAGPLGVPTRAREVPVERAALILVPASFGFDVSAVHEPLLAAVSQGSARGAVIAAACAGVEAVLATGVDRGRVVTTHWNLASRFSATYPQAKIDASDLVVDHGDLVTAGGILSWIDLGLHLVGRFWSPSVAVRCARVLVWDPGRRSQNPYAEPGLAWQPLVADPALAPAEAWIASNYRSAVGLEAWASAGSLGPRTLERRWKAAYGKGPRAWLRSVRVGEARQLLTASPRSWEEITVSVGYEDPGSFRRVFENETGWTPRRYRLAFAGS